MDLELLVTEQLRGYSLARTRAGLDPAAPAAGHVSPLHPMSRPDTEVDSFGVSQAFSSSSSSFAWGRQKARIDALDRRCLSLFATVEDVQRSLSNLEVTCSGQSLESVVRRAAMDLVRPAISSMHEQIRTDLTRVMNEVTSASSKAAAAYNAAVASRAEVSALTAARAVPNVHQILDESLVLDGGPGSMRFPDGSAYFRSRKEYEKKCEKEENRQELMWERIDNHLACHEIRLKQKIEHLVHAAILRSSVVTHAHQRQESGDESRPNGQTDQTNDRKIAQNHEPIMRYSHQHAGQAWSAREPIPIRDFLLLQRRFDELVLTVHDLTKAKGLVAKHEVAEGGGENDDEQTMGFNAKKDDEAAGLDNAIVMTGLDESMSRRRQADDDGDGQSAGDHDQVISGTVKELGLPESSTLSIDSNTAIVSDLRETVAMLQAQMLEMRDDIISAKLESSLRQSRVSKLEQCVRSLQDTLSREQLRQVDDGQSLQTTAVSSSQVSPSFSSVALECIGAGKPMHEWSVSEVDQWMLLIGTKEAVRRRFLELEIDGEMLSLLEKSDLEGGVGEDGVKTGMEISKAVGGSPEEGASEVERLLFEIAKLKCLHGVPVSPGGESAATGSEGDEQDRRLIYSSNTGSPTSSRGSPQASTISEMFTAQTSRATELENIKKQLASYGYNDL